LGRLARAVDVASEIAIQTASCGPGWSALFANDSESCHPRTLRPTWSEYCNRATMDPRLNFFFPFERVPAWHENQLTRALLVVLRYSPMAHEIWLRLVAPDREFHKLPKAQFATQRQRVLDENMELEDGESIAGLSVWLAPDATQVDTPVRASERLQILDGVVIYGNELVVVIENKVTWNKVTDQPHQINVHGSPVIFAMRPRSVSWQSLLDNWGSLIERDDLVPLAERQLIGDFFELIEVHFSNIGPYTTLSRCGGQKFRLERRLDAIQGEATGCSTGKGIGWRDIVNSTKIFMARLSLSDDVSAVCLQMYPADTLGQARAFYSDPESVQAVLRLREDGWSVAPNFHWGFRAPGYAWSTTPLSVEKYCAYWVEAIDSTVEVTRDAWDTYWSQLETARIVESRDRDAFDATFTRSQRHRASPRPGIFCEFRWPLFEAQVLDSGGKFPARVQIRINQLLAALGNSPVGPGAAA
jgi:hypothetical protein